VTDTRTPPFVDDAKRDVRPGDDALLENDMYIYGAENPCVVKPVVVTSAFGGVALVREITGYVASGPS